MNNKANKKKIYIAIGMVLLVLLLVIVIYKLYSDWNGTSCSAFGNRHL